MNTILSRMRAWPLNNAQICALLFTLLCCLSARASTVITATLAVTNAPANGATLTVGSYVRTWTNSVTSPQSQILTATNQTLAASALLNHLALFPFSGLTLGQSGLTNVTLRAATDAALTVSLSAGWGSVSYATNTIGAGSGVLVRIPITVESAAQQTNIASGLAAVINSAANTNPIVVQAANIVGAVAQAGHATNADVAVYSAQSGHSTNADLAVSAALATQAGHATTADNATLAANATAAYSPSTTNTPAPSLLGLAPDGKFSVTFAVTNSPATNAVLGWLQVTIGGTNYYLPLCSTNGP